MAIKFIHDAEKPESKTYRGEKKAVIKEQHEKTILALQLLMYK